MQGIQLEEAVQLLKDEQVALYREKKEVREELALRTRAVKFCIVLVPKPQAH